MDTAVVAIIISAVALGVSGYKVISDERDKRRKVRVRIGVVMPLSEFGAGPPLLEIHASIPRGKSAHLSSMSIAPPRGDWLAIFKPYYPVAFPYLLEEGKGVSVHVEAAVVGRLLKARGFAGKVKVRGVAYDATGDRYISKRLTFDVEGWSKADSPAAEPA